MLQGIRAGEGDPIPGEREVVGTDGRVLKVTDKHLDGVCCATVGEFEEGDVVQPEVVAACVRVLVDDGDGGLCVGAAVPDDVEVVPGVGRPVGGGRGEDVADLLPVDAELQLGPWAVGHGGDPCGEGVVGGGRDVDGLRPDDRARGGGPVDDHIVAVPAGVVGAPLEVGVVVAGIAPHIVGALAPQVGVQGVAAREPGAALLEVAVTNQVDARVIAGNEDVHRLAGSADGMVCDRAAKAAGGGPDVVVGAGGGKSHALARVEDGVAGAVNGRQRVDAQGERDDAVAARPVGRCAHIYACGAPVDTVGRQVETVLGVVFALAGVAKNGKVGRRAHHKGHHHHAVAAVRGGEDDGLRARLRECHPVPDVGQQEIADAVLHESGVGEDTVDVKSREIPTRQGLSLESAEGQQENENVPTEPPCLGGHAGARMLFNMGRLVEHKLQLRCSFSAVCYKQNNSLQR